MWLRGWIKCGFIKEKNLTSAFIMSFLISGCATQLYSNPEIQNPILIQALNTEYGDGKKILDNRKNVWDVPLNKQEIPVVLRDKYAPSKNHDAFILKLLQKMGNEISGVPTRDSLEKYLRSNEVRCMPSLEILPDLMICEFDNVGITVYPSGTSTQKRRLISAAGYNRYYLYWLFNGEAPESNLVKFTINSVGDSLFSALPRSLSCLVNGDVRLENKKNVY